MSKSKAISISRSTYRFVLFCMVMTTLLMIATGAALAQLTPEQELGQQGIDFLNSLGAGWAVAAIFVARQLAEVGAKLIPDGSGGIWGIVRKVLKIIAVYVPNQK